MLRGLFPAGDLGPAAVGVALGHHDQSVVQLGGGPEHAVHTELEVGPAAADVPNQRQRVQHPERVIGHHHERTRFRNPLEVVLRDLEGHAQGGKGRVDEGVPRQRRQGLELRVDLADSAEPVQQADQRMPFGQARPPREVRPAEQVVVVCPFVLHPEQISPHPGDSSLRRALF